MYAITWLEGWGVRTDMTMTQRSRTVVGGCPVGNNESHIPERDIYDCVRRCGLENVVPDGRLS